MCPRTYRQWVLEPRVDPHRAPLAQAEWVREPHPGALGAGLDVIAPWLLDSLESLACLGTSGRGLGALLFIKDSGKGVAIESPAGLAALEGQVAERGTALPLLLSSCCQLSLTAP